MLPRLLTFADLPALMQLKASAGWNQTEYDWRRILELEPRGCFGIESEGSLAAAATVICYGNDLAWVGMVLTLPEFRRRGFARELMKAVLEYAAPRRTGLDASDAGQPLYESLDFTVECLIERWIRPGRRPDPEPPGAAGAVRPGVLALDRATTGADRSRLLASLARFGFDHDGSGFAFSRPGSEAHYFGPCATERKSSAEEFLNRFLARHPGDALAWDLFPQNGMAVSLARAAGFEPARTLARMILKPSAPRQPDPRQIAIAGFELA